MPPQILYRFSIRILMGKNTVLTNKTMQTYADTFLSNPIFMVTNRKKYPDIQMLSVRDIHCL